RAVANLDLGTLDRHVQTPRRVDGVAGERRARADDDRVRGRTCPHRIQRLAAADPEPAPLARREAPVPGMRPEDAALLVDDRPVTRDEATAFQEGAVCGHAR